MQVFKLSIPNNAHPPTQSPRNRTKVPRPYFPRVFRRGEENRSGNETKGGAGAGGGGGGHLGTSLNQLATCPTFSCSVFKSGCLAAFLVASRTERVYNYVPDAGSLCRGMRKWTIITSEMRELLIIAFIISCSVI